MEFLGKTGQTVLPKCRAQPDKHTNHRHSVYRLPVQIVIFSLSLPLFGSFPKHAVVSLRQLQNALFPCIPHPLGSNLLEPAAAVVTLEVDFRLAHGAGGSPVTVLAGSPAGCFSALLCVCEDEAFLMKLTQHWVSFLGEGCFMSQ